jgi:hypothetical protein
VAPADRQPPDPSRWQIATPPVATREPLRVDLDEPLDHALLSRLVWVEDDSGAVLDGTIEVSSGERSWAFTPDRPWRGGSYALGVDRRLEDLAGNRVGRAFEVDLTRSSAGDEPSRQPVRLAITIAR